MRKPTGRPKKTIEWWKVRIQALKEAKKECNAALNDAKIKCQHLVKGTKPPVTKGIKKDIKAKIQKQQKDVKAQVKATTDTAKTQSLPGAKQHRLATHVIDKLGPPPPPPPAKEQDGTRGEPGVIEDKLGPPEHISLGGSKMINGWAEKVPKCDAVFTAVTAQCNKLLAIAAPDERDHFDSKHITIIFNMFKKYQKDAKEHMAALSKIMKAKEPK